MSTPTAREPLLAKPLVIVTRALIDCDDLLVAISEMGARGEALPCIEQKVLSDFPAADKLPPQFTAHTILAFTSRFGVHAFAKLCLTLGRPLPREPDLWAVGKVTATLAEQFFMRPVSHAEPADAAHLASALTTAYRARGTHTVYLPGALERPATLRDALIAAGFAAIDLPIYRTQVPAKNPRPLAWTIVPRYVLFASASAVAGFLNLTTWPRGARALSIGPQTSAALRDSGIAPFREAAAHDAKGLLAALQDCLREDKSNTQ